MSQLLVFTLDEQRYGLYLAVVESVLRVLEITPLPKVPNIAIGVINLRGQILPVINLRRRFGLPEREINLGDLLIVARTPRRTITLLVDAVSGVVENTSRRVIGTAEVLPGIQWVEGILKLEDDMILIYDLDNCLSLEEEGILDEALERA